MNLSSESKTCQNCKNQFVIEPEDFLFYEKMKIPSPTFCPECRRQRRLAWKNDMNFYSRDCYLCNKKIISIYSSDKPFPVYCNKCWWSDKWDPKNYGREYNFNRSFFEQFKELQNEVPMIALINDNDIASENCEYTQDFAFGKNCYMVITAWKLEECLNSYGMVGTKDAADCLFLFEGGQKMYESIFSDKCYNSKYIYNSIALTDSSFCFDCRDCNNCFMSVGLRHKQYCIKNNQYSKEEYTQVLESYRLDTFSGIEKAKKEFWDFTMQFPRRFAMIRNSVNCTGDYLVHSKNCRLCFNSRNLEDCRYQDIGDGAKDSYDLSGGELSQCYEAITSDHSYRSLFSIYSWKNTEVTYVDNCHSSKNLFGCVGMKKAQYCVLNKQYSKDDYEALITKIIENMKTCREWGEFFPISLSKFGYNETLAQDSHSLTKQEAVKKCYSWQDNLQFTKDKGTVKPENLPDSINDAEDSILEEVLTCMKCSRNYKIVPKELEFYRSMKIPIPRKCFYCRHGERLKIKTSSNLWRRKCQCAGENSENSVYKNQTTHFHNQEHCPNEFETSYAPERKEIVYCEECYQQEII